MSLLFLIIPSVLVIAVLFFLGKGRIVWWEILVHLGVVVGLMTGGWFAARWGATQDTEIWNGTVASKPVETQGCCHSYECNCTPICTPDTEGNISCHESCSTCYEHSHDVRFRAVTSNREVIFSDGCNAPGSSPPAKWESIRIGEPTAVEHRYTNYIKAAPGTLFQQRGLVEKYKDVLPDYPKVKGWRVDRMLFVGIKKPGEHERWNNQLMQVNGKLGAEKQVNVVVVVTSRSQEFYDALAAHWLGGKKNDFILVVGAQAYPRIDWVRIMSWMDPVGEGEAAGIHESIPRLILGLREFDGDRALEILEREVRAGFVRKPMSDFKYLMKGAEPPLWALIVLGLVGLLTSAILGCWFWQNEYRKGA